MYDKYLKGLAKNVITIDFIAMLLLSAVILFFNVTAGVICAVLVVVLRVYHLKSSEKSLANNIHSLKEDVITQSNAVSKMIAEASPLLICIVSQDGHLVWTNPSFDEEIGNQDAFEEIGGVALTQKFISNADFHEELMVGEKTFAVTSTVASELDQTIMLFWQNVSAKESLKQLYSDRKACMALIDVDNYEDILESSRAEEQSVVAAQIDREIHTFALGLGAALVRIKKGRYIMVFQNQYMQTLREMRFPILDKMHEIETSADFPTSISVGIGVGEAGLDELYESATEALEFAIGRGGDQVVVRTKGGDVEYYGGTLPTVEKRNKGKSRIMAHMISQLIEDSDRVLVMGHANPDMDALGSAIGIYYLATSLGRTVDIVLSNPNESIETAYKAAIAEGEYSFLSSSDALDVVTKDTLVIIVDNHIAPICECPELLDAAKRFVVIDHHRKSKNAIENTLLAHMEVYASSTSELVTEILQYSKLKGDISKFVAEALLAGMVLDTKNFTVNTGVRTFEAASWLRRCGADIAVVRTFFKTKLDLYQKKASLIASAEVLGNGIAVAYTKLEDPAMQMLAAQTADELLDMQGIEAAFVAGSDGERTVISARSLGKINVQVIMEALGGGGHQIASAAQVGEKPEEAIAKLVGILREEELL